MTSAHQREGPAPGAAPDAEGRIEVRVRYCECDPMGVAHHASYIAWLEMGRTELLRPSGVSYRDLEESGVLLAVSRLEIRYRLPARYDDVLSLLTRVSGGGRARIDHEYEVWRPARPGADRGVGDMLIATASSTLACIDRTGRPRPLPAWLAADGIAAKRRDSIRADGRQH